MGSVGIVVCKHGTHLGLFSEGIFNAANMNSSLFAFLIWKYHPGESELKKTNIRGTRDFDLLCFYSLLWTRFCNDLFGCDVLTCFSFHC